MYYRRNADEELRKLERAVSSGAMDKEEALQAARIRSGLCPGCGGPIHPDFLGYRLCPKCDPLTVSWDTYEIAKDNVEYVIQQSQEDFEAGEIDAVLTEDEALSQAYNDPVIYEMQWEWIQEQLNDWMKEYNPDFLNWCITGENMGWRRVSGAKEIPYREAETAEDLIRKILPDTECSYTIYYSGESLWIVNSHHDASGEVYRIELAKKCPHCDEEYCDDEELAECCKYECKNCSERYSEKYNADNCCYSYNEDEDDEDEDDEDYSD